MWKPTLLIIFSLTICGFSWKSLFSNELEINYTSALSEIKIGEPLSGVDSREPKMFFGLHALFWGVQSDLFESPHSEVSSKAIDILRESGVGFIRYGGGVNEVDWRGCVGDVNGRPKQKLVDWAAPMRCQFGLAEYEKLNNELNLSSSWHIANVVGFEGKENPVSELEKDAGERSKLIKDLSGNRHRFWEIGNELERDTLKWEAKKIVERGLPVAQAILKNDPAARVIVPLLEYKPEWVNDENEHNRYLIHHYKTVANDFALHTYYDNPPWGPSVEHQLGVIRKVAEIISSEGFANPGIWITEHARPPAGTPKDSNWEKNWYQTGNHDAVIASADFLIGLSQISMVKGASWHGLRAGPWNFIDVTTGVGPHQTRMARLFEMLVPASHLQILATKTESVYDLSLVDGYAIRAAAFVEKNDFKNKKLVVWLVNRSLSDKDVSISNESFRDLPTIDLSQVNLTESYDPSVPISKLPVITKHVNPVNGKITVSLPKRSVVLLSIKT